MNCILIDDEPDCVQSLSKLVDQFCNGLHIAGTAHTVQEGIDLIGKLHPDLVFLDIEMPDGSGFDLLSRFSEVDFEIIFVTAHEGYAVKAIRFSALDYLLKPVDIDELREAVARALQRTREKTIHSRIDNLLHNHRSHASKIALPALDGMIFYDIDDIVFCKAEGPYTQFLFTGNKKITVTGTLKEFESVLPADVFCRVHHSHLVNINHIKRYYKGKGGYLEMDNGNTVEISQRKKEEFLARFGK